MPELLHPRMADVYRDKVRSLSRALESEDSRASAVEGIRALIETILLEPDGNQLKITLKGDLAGMLSAAIGKGESRNVTGVLRTYTEAR